MRTGFFWDERTFWHSGGQYAFTAPVGGLVQPLAAGGLPENPETKRRLVNLMRVTGLIRAVAAQTARAADESELTRVHPPAFLARFKALSDGDGGELGPRAPFGHGGFERAALSAGLARGALFAVLEGDCRNAYALSRPPGHHCLPELPNGFCLLANIAIAVEAALAEGLTDRVAVIDWDVHHGNGTEAIFYDRPEVLTVSIHQDRNYPLDTGDATDRGAGAGLGANVNIPLPAGSGHATYLEAFERLVAPAVRDFAPDVIVVACGFDAGAIDPLGRMLATAETFRQLTALAMDLAADLCEDRLVLVHEGGYSELHVPFCAHGVIAELAASPIAAPDPLADTLSARQPGPAQERWLSSVIDDLQTALGI